VVRDNLSATNPTRLYLGSHSGHRDGKPATKSMSYGTAYLCLRLYLGSHPGHRDGKPATKSMSYGTAYLCLSEYEVRVLHFR
jgi:hypothetical protein